MRQVVQSALRTQVDLKYKNLSIYHEAGKCPSLSNNVRVVSPGGDGLLSLSGHC